MVIIEDTRQQDGKHDIKHEWFEKNNVTIVRSKLPFGDYALVPKVTIDTKRNMDEIAGNICGKEHKRFIAECKKARDAGCKLIILVENELNISDISQVHSWENPRSVYSANCVQGARLQKAMETISERYDVDFRFCCPDDAAKIIAEVLSEYEE